MPRLKRAQKLTWAKHEDVCISIDGFVRVGTKQRRTVKYEATKGHQAMCQHPPPVYDMYIEAIN